jgi:hypothetical protein
VSGGGGSGLRGTKGLSKQLTMRYQQEIPLPDRLALKWDLLMHVVLLNFGLSFWY